MIPTILRILSLLTGAVLGLAVIAAGAALAHVGSGNALLGGIITAAFVVAMYWLPRSSERARAARRRREG